MRRRSFISHAIAASAGLLAVPAVMQRVLAAVGEPATRFIFVVNRGGWDPLLTLAPMLDAPAITAPPATTRAVVGGIAFADAATRPAVRQYFERWASRTVVVHGLSVRSVAHEVCEMTMLTGASTGDEADHATRLAAALPGAALPHLVIGGPTLSGPDASITTRIGQRGQLQGLVDGSALARSDLPVVPMPTPSGDLVERFLDRRVAAFVDAGPPSRASYAAAHARASGLVDLRRDLRLVSDGTFEAQSRTAVEALARGLARCVTIAPPLGWDTHVDSDNQQSQLWQTFFGGLNALVASLAGTPGVRGTPLLDETVIVVTSEMARTPGLNADGGRDHWPWTSALLVGGPIRGGRVIGGYDGGYRGLGVDPVDGSPTEALGAPTPRDLGATLLALSDLDPMLAGVGATPIGGII